MLSLSLIQLFSLPALNNFTIFIPLPWCKSWLKYSSKEGGKKTSNSRFKYNGCVTKIIKIGIRYHGGYRNCFNKNLNTLSCCYREIRTKVKETNFRTLLLLKVILKLSFKKNYFKTFVLNKVTLLNQFFFSNYLCSSRWNGGRFIKRRKLSIN